MNVFVPANVMMGVSGLAGAVLVLVILIFTYRHLTKKVGPHQALIVYGRKGTRIVVGGATFVNPVTEQFRHFSLELLSFKVAPATLYTAQKMAVDVEAAAQLKVRTNDMECIRLAAEQFLNKTVEEREQIVCQVLEGHLRNVVGGVTLDDLVTQTARVAELMRASASPDLEQMGLGVVSFTLKQVRESKDVFAHLGKGSDRMERLVPAPVEFVMEPSEMRNQQEGMTGSEAVLPVSKRKRAAQRLDKGPHEETFGAPGSGTGAERTRS
jgi:uncharacterized membrane protein YqiK